MSVQHLTADDDENANRYVLAAKLNNSKTLASILKAIHFSDHATFCGLPSGLKAIVEDFQCVQGNAFIDAQIFQSYELIKNIRFRIHLNTLLECLNIFGLSENSDSIVALQIYYMGEGHPLQLYLEEHGVITECSIKLLDADETIDFEFQTENILAKIMLKADGFKEALSEIDLKADCIELLISEQNPQFRLIANGVGGSSSVDITKTSEIMESFLCTQTIHNRYKTQFFQYIIKALTIATKVSLRIDGRGILCIQFLIYTEEDKASLVEYFFCPSDEIDDQTNMQTNDDSNQV
ncbi:unnamed protein product [Didymodactylos carnosus]|uniref:Cell cycle checkpoint protein RAD1 n=1 Tax=Didymodactylos carnosus TaxID=1234261 RepID=A0A813VSL5_9BILA|nr:unnamed protein product [Didymodactylos carnosus]CAF0845842.1 unnamed protein product [Didymodactylos carnosus]CAF3497524.1 unnamed protein product [Didymodactylos carnosus]CAF3633463.1 unnamed protein product [Didymodactylos carnosus]